jgi:hypothetical protein
MTQESNRVFLAKTCDPQGYWGKHKDGVHHAIAQCCDGGANRFGIFAVYEGPASIHCDSIHGNLVWDIDPANPDDKPTLEGIYTAGGIHLADSLAELAQDVQKGRVEPEEYALDRNTVRALQTHKPE